MTTTWHSTARWWVALTTVLGAFVVALSVPAVTSASPRPAAAKLGPLLFIGDSVGQSIQGNVQPLLSAGGYPYWYDALSGRCAMQRTNSRCATNNAMAAMAAVPASFKPTFAVIELGYNDLTTTLAAGIDQLMRALLAKGVQKVFWINMSERRPDPRGGVIYDDYNAILRAGARRWPQITVLDWNAASSGADKTSWFVQYKDGKPDLIHLTAIGRPKFAQFIRNELDRLKDAGVLPGTTPPTTKPTTTKPPATGARPEIRRGDSGPYVLQLQTELVRRGATIAKDGRFGPGTEAAVKAFQRKAGLHVDGIVGPRTWKALGF